MHLLSKLSGNSEDRPLILCPPGLLSEIRNIHPTINIAPVIYSRVDILFSLFISIRHIKYFLAFCNRYKLKNAFQVVAVLFEAPMKYRYYNKVVAQPANPKIIISNLHNNTNRIIQLVANEHRAKTVYIQHGLPFETLPLPRASLNILYGKQSVDVLTKNKFAKHIKNQLLYGSVALRGEIALRTSPSLQPSTIIGCTLGLQDSFEKAVRILGKLAENSRYKILIKPHPRSRRNSFVNATLPPRLELETGNIDLFLSKVCCVLYCSSSAAIDAAISGLPTYYIDLDGDFMTDRYGFVKNKLSVYLNKDSVLSRFLAGTSFNSIEAQACKVGLDYYLSSVPSTAHDYHLDLFSLACAIREL